MQDEEVKKEEVVESPVVPEETKVTDVPEAPATSTESGESPVVVEEVKVEEPKKEEIFTTPVDSGIPGRVTMGERNPDGSEKA